MCVGERERERERERDFNELAHTVVEALQDQNMQGISADWEPQGRVIVSVYNTGQWYQY